MSCLRHAAFLPPPPHTAHWEQLKHRTGTEWGGGGGGYRRKCCTRRVWPSAFHSLSWPPEPWYVKQWTWGESQNSCPIVRRSQTTTEPRVLFPDSMREHKEAGGALINSLNMEIITIIISNICVPPHSAQSRCLIRLVEHSLVFPTWPGITPAERWFPASLESRYGRK